MEFFDEDRPRLVLQSRSSPAPIPTAAGKFSAFSLHKPTLFISLSLSILFFSISIFYFNLEPFQSIFLWLSISLLVGPFAPLSLTAGDIRVGVGPPVTSPPPMVENEGIVSNKKPNKKSSKIHQRVEPVGAGSGAGSVSEVKKENGLASDFKKDEGGGGNVVREGDWNEADVELLKKLVGKHPVGKPGRWEAIADGFKGRYRVESVIKKSKEMGEKKMGDEDSYKRFLKDRKQVDSRIEGENVNEAVGNAQLKGESGSIWSAGDDLALLNALKAFPKDAAKRWEKVSAAVPGKTKAACMKRVTELKKDFRSSKAASGEA